MPPPKSILSLLQNKVVLNNVARLTVTVCKRGEGQAGARAFLTDHVPALKFHNEGIPINRAITKEVNAHPKLTIETSNGTTEEFDLFKLESGKVMDILVEKNFVATKESSRGDDHQSS